MDEHTEIEQLRAEIKQLREALMIGWTFQHDPTNNNSEAFERIAGDLLRDQIRASEQSARGKANG